jgi:peptidoglycan/LPS O-acetylase OafA/YrhL
MDAQPSRRDNNFDFIRLVAASLVLMSHSYALTGEGGVEPVVRLTHGQYSAGGLSVRVFFVVSGLLVTQSWLRTPRLTAFVSARALRILPALALAMAYCVAIGAFTGTLPWRAFLGHPETWRYVWHNLTMRTEFYLPGVFEKNVYPRAVNGSIWSIAYEVRAYVVVAALGLLGVLRSRWTGMLGWILAGALIWWWPAAWGTVANDAPVVSAFLCFVVAATVALVPSALAYSGWAALGLALTLPISPSPAWRDYHVDALLCAGTLWMGHRPMRLLRGFGRFGDLSYGIFIFAFPTQQVLAWSLHLDHRPSLMTACALPATLVLAAASWWLVERPSLGVKKAVANRIDRGLALVRGALEQQVRRAAYLWAQRAGRR